MDAVLLANVFTDASAWLEDFSSRWYFLLIIFVVAYLDSVVPIVPSETMVIVGGVAAGVGEQSLVLVIVAGAVGAALGDKDGALVGNALGAVVGARDGAKVGDCADQCTHSDNHSLNCLKYLI